ncbi:hypothetical protein K445DRAFT_109073 [Daldinia sp. EC12]|nr:hypothetical protein K445DRAFT_109073 [Daldinia sp. EC12]
MVTGYQAKRQALSFNSHQWRPFWLFWHKYGRRRGRQLFLVTTVVQLLSKMSKVKDVFFFFFSFFSSRPEGGPRARDNAITKLTTYVELQNSLHMLYLIVSLSLTP